MPTVAATVTIKNIIAIMVKMLVSFVLEVFCNNIFLFITIHIWRYAFVCVIVMFLLIQLIAWHGDKLGTAILMVPGSHIMIKVV